MLRSRSWIDHTPATKHSKKEKKTHPYVHNNNKKWTTIGLRIFYDSKVGIVLSTGMRLASSCSHLPPQNGGRMHSESWRGLSVKDPKRTKRKPHQPAPTDQFQPTKTRVHRVPSEGIRDLAAFTWHLYQLIGLDNLLHTELLWVPYFELTHVGNNEPSRLASFQEDEQSPVPSERPKPKPIPAKWRLHKPTLSPCSQLRMPWPSLGFGLGWLCRLVGGERLGPAPSRRPGTASPESTPGFAPQKAPRLEEWPHGDSILEKETWAKKMAFRAGCCLKDGELVTLLSMLPWYFQKSKIPRENKNQTPTQPAWIHRV